LNKNISIKTSTYHRWKDVKVFLWNLHTARCSVNGKVRLGVIRFGWSRQYCPTHLKPLFLRTFSRHTSVQHTVFCSSIDSLAFLMPIQSVEMGYSNSWSHTTDCNVLQNQSRPHVSQKTVLGVKTRWPISLKMLKYWIEECKVAMWTCLPLSGREFEEWCTLYCLRVKNAWIAGTTHSLVWKHFRCS